MDVYFRVIEIEGVANATDDGDTIFVVAQEVGADLPTLLKIKPDAYAALVAEVEEDRAEADTAEEDEEAVWQALWTEFGANLEAD